MNASYRLGLNAVLVTVAASAATVALTVRPSSPPVAETLDDRPAHLGPFQLVERSGESVTDADLAGRVWVASFIFTRCPSSCPKISARMKDLQGRFARSSVHLVSLTVDPEYDTPEVLTLYARTLGADPARWWFLTGPEEALHDLIVDRFQQGLTKTTSADQAQGAEAFSHSARLALVDRGNRVVGFYDANDPAAVGRLISKARRLDAPAWARWLPTVNASLNGTCALLLLVGWSLIRRGRVRGHTTCMVAGIVVSALFLSCYLLYHYLVGSMPFRSAGPIRGVYFTILLSHTLLAVAVVPLIVVTLIWALRSRFQEHVRIARVTFPIWLYVSITGVIIYVMLYHLPAPISGP